MSERARRVRAAFGVALACTLVQPLHVAPDSVFLEELTSTELRQRIAAGATTALVPIGGTEQNGAHMVLGKHNVRVHVLAGRIARQLGQAIVAPVMATVSPPCGSQASASRPSGSATARPGRRRRSSSASASGVAGCCWTSPWTRPWRDRSAIFRVSWRRRATA